MDVRPRTNRRTELQPSRLSYLDCCCSHARLTALLEVVNKQPLMVRLPWQPKPVRTHPFAHVDTETSRLGLRGLSLHS